MTIHDRIFFYSYFPLYAFSNSLQVDAYRIIGIGLLIAYPLVSMLLKKQFLIKTDVLLFSLLFVIIPMLRSFMAGTISMSFAILTIAQFLSLFIFCSVILSNKKVDLFKHFEFSLYFLVLIFLFTYIIGKQNVLEFKEPAVLLSYLGVNSSRVFFWMSPGINATGYLAGYVIVSTFYKLLNGEKRNNLFYVITLLSAIAVWLLSDSRGALLGIVFVLVLVKFGLISKFLKNLYLHPLFVVIIIGLVLYLILNAGISEHISRGRYPLGGREFIWFYSMTAIISDLHHLFFGYGYLGQTTSMVYMDYQFVFGINRASPETMSLHNYIFQMIYDVGILGLMAFYYLIKKNINYEEVNSINVFLSYALFMGILEVTLNIYAFYFFIFAAITVVQDGREK